MIEEIEKKPVVKILNEYFDYLHLLMAIDFQLNSDRERNLIEKRKIIKYIISGDENIINNFFKTLNIKHKDLLERCYEFVIKYEIKFKGFITIEKYSDVQQEVERVYMESLMNRKKFTVTTKTKDVLSLLEKSVKYEEKQKIKKIEKNRTRKQISINVSFDSIIYVANNNDFIKNSYSKKELKNFDKRVFTLLCSRKNFNTLCRKYLKTQEPIVKNLRNKTFTELQTPQGIFKLDSKNLDGSFDDFLTKSIECSFDVNGKTIILL
jgi:hypothetical protein